MRGLLRPLLLPLLRRDPREVDRAAARFMMESSEDREIVSRLGRAFLDGYNRTLEAENLGQVKALGDRVEPHYRPFFFEGAAMGYLPRGYVRSGCTRERVEDDLLRLDPSFLYLYYVGLGFWYGFRHPRRPERIQELAEHVDALYFPLCYDGFGFKVGFFDFPRRPASARLLDRCPAEHRAYAYQGFGRSLFFVYRDRPELAFDAVGATPGRGHGYDLELGRSLACGFTGIHRPQRLLDYLAQAPEAERLAARLTGITWALAARKLNDPDYFGRCLEGCATGDRELLRRLPSLCERALEEVESYPRWQAATREAAMTAYEAVRRASQA